MSRRGWTTQIEEGYEHELGELHVVCSSFRPDAEDVCQLDSKLFCYYHGTKAECEAALVLMLAGKGGSPTLGKTTGGE